MAAPAPRAADRAALVLRGLLPRGWWIPRLVPAIDDSTPAPPPAAVRPTLASLARMRGRVGPARYATTGDSGGGHGGRRRGRGLDHEHTRRHVPGDDARHIDWPTSARRGSLHTRVYREERRRTLVCVIDGHPGMHFGTRGAFKWSAAAHAAAAHAWCAHDEGGRAALVLVGGDAPLWHPPTGTRRGLLGLLRALAGHLAAQDGSTAGTATTALEQALRLAPAGAELHLYSDLHDADTALGMGLRRACGRHRVRVTWIRDTLESEPPPAGVYPVIQDGKRRRLSVGEAEAAGWREGFRQRRDTLAALVRGAGAGFTELETARAAQSLLIR